MKKIVLTIVVLLLAGIAAGAVYKLRSGRDEPQVVTALVTRGDVVEKVGATGTLEAVTTVQVGSQVSGTVKELGADFNSVVRKGQVVARLDPSLFQTQVDQARANLLRSQADVQRLAVAVDDARSKLTRAQELSRRSLIPQQDLETAEITVRSNEAQLASARAQVTQSAAALSQADVNLRHTVIEAPIDGIVISRNVDVGQTVAASLQAPTLFVIAADLTKMRVNASIDEADVGRIRPGQTVRFRVDAFPEDEFTGRVSQVRLQPVVVQNVVTYATQIDVPNPDLRLKPGMTANVNIEIAARNDVVRVPAAALRFRPTADTFAALDQALPPELQRAGAPGGGQAASKAGAAPAQSPGAASPDASGRAMGGARANTGHTPAAAGASTPADVPGAGAASPRPRGAGNGQPFERQAGAGPDAGAQEAGGARQGRSGGAPGDWRARRGAAAPGEAEGGAGGRPAAPNADAGRTRANTVPQGAANGAWQDATSVDALFAPLPTSETSGRVWVYMNKQLKPVRLRLGVSDGTWTEVLSGGLEPNTPVVTSVVLPSTSTTSSSSTAGRSPLMGPQRGGPGGRGPGGR